MHCSGLVVSNTALSGGQSPRPGIHNSKGGVAATYRRKANSHMGTHGRTSSSSSGSTQSVNSLRERRADVCHWGRRRAGAPETRLVPGPSPIGAHDLLWRRGSTRLRRSSRRRLITVPISTWYRCSRHVGSASSREWTCIFKTASYPFPVRLSDQLLP